MEIEENAGGLWMPVLLTLSAVVIALASLILHLLFPPSKNTLRK